MHAYTGIYPFLCLPMISRVKLRNIEPAWFHTLHAQEPCKYKVGLRRITVLRWNEINDDWSKI